MQKIVVVEDDDTIRDILSRTLTAEGYHCFLAGDVAGGLAVCRRERPDLILLDVTLPDGDGIEVCRRIKADEGLRCAAVLLVSGVAAEVEHRIAGLEAGADGYFVKPFRLNELVGSIRQVLAPRLPVSGAPQSAGPPS